MTKVISFSSGKGGVGKTTLVANIGALSAKRGQKTLLIDGDWSLGKLGILFGSRPKWTVERVLDGSVSLAGAIHSVGPNLSILGSPSGLVGFEEIHEAERNQLFFEMDQLANQYDLILFDHASGVNWGVLQFAAASHQHVIVTTAEPTAYTDAYAIMKILSKRFALRDFSLIVTMSSYRPETERIISRFSEVARSHLDIRLQLLDIIPWEPKLAESIRRQQPFVDIYPRCELTQALGAIWTKLDRLPCSSLGGLKFFYSDLVGEPLGESRAVRFGT